MFIPSRLTRSILAIALALASLYASTGPGLSSGRTSAGTLPAASPHVSSLPLVFEANRGQAGRDVRYLARAPHVTVLLTGTGVRLSVLPTNPGGDRARNPRGDPFSGRHLPMRSASTNRSAQGMSVRPATITLEPVGMSSQTRIVPQGRLPGIVNYFIGDNPARWHTNIPTYAGVLYENVYPGITLHFYAGRQGFEYDWLLAPGADPGRIRLRISGATVGHGPNGTLVLRSGGVALREGRPQSYSGAAATRHAVRSAYVLTHAHEIRFRVGSHPWEAPLVIDPTLVYATYLGGGADESGYALTVDAQGNAYVTGDTQSSDFPLANAAQGVLQSAPTCVAAGNRPSECPDAFVSKLSPDGHTLLYSTYLGGTLDDYGHGIAVDGQGNAYVTGNTLSPDFPIVSALDAHFGGGHDLGDAYITRLNPQGNAIVFSTFLGGTGDDDAEGIAEWSGSIYVTGMTNSPDFPTAHAWQPALAGGSCTQPSPSTGLISQTCPDAFVTKLPDSGASLTYSTYLGGTRQETATSIAVRNGSAYVTGSTASTDFPAVHPLQGYSGGTCGTDQQPYPCEDGYLTVLAPEGNGALFSTYIGGTADDIVNHVAVGADGRIYLAGNTRSTDFPLVHPLKATMAQDDEDAFVTEVNAPGTKVQFSTYLGGADPDDANGIAVDDAGDMFVTGSTLSADFPLRDPIQSTLPTVEDPAGGRGPVQTGYVTALKPDGSDFLYSTYFGDAAAGEEDVRDATYGAAIAVDGADDAYVTGFTRSDTLPVTTSAFQTGFGGSFVAKIHQPVPRPPSPTPVPTSTATPIPTHTAVPTRTPVSRPKKCKKGYKLVHGKCKKVKKKRSGAS